MTRVRIALISKPEMNFTETADFLEDYLNDNAFKATCIRMPSEWVVFVTILPHLLEGLLEWCRISTFSARYIDSARVTPEENSIEVESGVTVISTEYLPDTGIAILGIHDIETDDYGETPLSVDEVGKLIGLLTSLHNIMKGEEKNSDE